MRRLTSRWHLYDDAELAAMDLANKEGLTMCLLRRSLHSERRWYCWIEMLLDEPDLDMIVVWPGRGLITGIAIAAKALSPGIKIIGVQSVASMPWVVSWQSGRVVNVCYSETLADGLTGTIPQSLLDLARTCVDDFIAVTEEEIAKAIAFSIKNTIK